MRWQHYVVLIFIIFYARPSLCKSTSTDITAFYKSARYYCPLIVDTHAVITPSDCNVADGSITGIIITGVGNLTIAWYDDNAVIIGSTADLLNVPPGTYTLEVHDGTKCLPEKKIYVVPQKNNIIIDDSRIIIAAAGCNQNNGAITNINLQNSAQYQWLDYQGNVIATNTPLLNVPSGEYSLFVTGTTGCTTTNTYQVPSSVHFPAVTKIDTILGVCNYTASSVTLTFDIQSTDPIYNYSLLDPTTGQTVIDPATGPVTGIVSYNASAPTKILLPLDLPNLPYSLQLSVNGSFCTAIIGQYSLPPVVFKIVTNGPFFLVRNDACGRHTGGIFEVKVVGGTKSLIPPGQIWTWTDSLGNVLSHDVGSFSGLGKGTYTVFVQDLHGCNDSKQFTINDSTAEALPPALSGITLCLPGPTTLLVVNPNHAYKYKLYDSTQTLIDENSSGIFPVKVTRTSKFYATTVIGLCESDQTPVTVVVVAPGVIIPNTFTPNNDGINDFWVIPHVGDFPGAEVSIFTRDGLLIYHSINYPNPFDGKYNGATLPAGVYYYLIDLKTPECFGKISGSLTLIR